MNVYVVNEATTYSDHDAGRLAIALDLQAQRDLIPWRADVRCHYLTGGAKAVIPSGGAVLSLLDTSDQQGALGYHDEDGSEVPYARVFVQDAVSDGDSASEVASHEMLELAVDPHVNLSALTGDGTKLYALEVGDPVQGNPYDVGAPSGRTTGIQVADFVLPSYFDPNTPASELTSFRGAIRGPFTLAPQGYVSFIDMNNVPAGWQQIFGEKRTSLPRWSFRLGQR